MRRHLAPLALVSLLGATAVIVALSIAPPTPTPASRAGAEPAAARGGSDTGAVDPASTPAPTRAPVTALARGVDAPDAPDAPATHADAEALLVELDRLATLDGDSVEHRMLESSLMDGMIDLARRDPAAAARLARELVRRSARGEDIRMISTALGGARTAEATDALAGTLDRIEGFDRRDVMGILGIAPTPTVDSLDVLDGMREGRYERAAAMAMGGQIHRLAEQAPEAAAQAAARLVEGYQTAGSAMERRAYAIALGNAGDRAGLPIVLDMLAHEPSQTETALLALRYMPGDDVDATLEGYLGAPGPHATAAIRSVSRRDAERWTPVLERLRAAYGAAGLDDERAVQLIDSALLRWARQG